MDAFFQYLSSLAPLPEELQAALVTRTTCETYRKNKVMLSVGQICDWIGLVEEGLVKVCYDIPGGEERIVQFARKGEMVFGVGSFTSGQPSRLSIVTIEDSIFRKISKNELDMLTQRFAAFHLHVRKIIEMQTLHLEAHYLLFARAPRERFRCLLAEESWLLSDKRVKDYMIAAFLGVDRATFSRFRNLR